MVALRWSRTGGVIQVGEPQDQQALVVVTKDGELPQGFKSHAYLTTGGHQSEIASGSILVSETNSLVVPSGDGSVGAGSLVFDQFTNGLRVWDAATGELHSLPRVMSGIETSRGRPVYAGGHVWWTEAKDTGSGVLVDVRSSLATGASPTLRASSTAPVHAGSLNDAWSYVYDTEVHVIVEYDVGGGSHEHQFGVIPLSGGSDTWSSVPSGYAPTGFNGGPVFPSGHRLSDGRMLFSTPSLTTQPLIRGKNTGESYSNYWTIDLAGDAYFRVPVPGPSGDVFRMVHLGSGKYKAWWGSEGATEAEREIILDDNPDFPSYLVAAAAPVI